jgi:hypothetical protein
MRCCWMPGSRAKPWNDPSPGRSNSGPKSAARWNPYCAGIMCWRSAGQATSSRSPPAWPRWILPPAVSAWSSISTPAHFIADALKQFGTVVKSLPEADQKELVQLIIKEVSVKHFDPETDPTPKENGVFKTKIRTKWYLVNISLFASDLFKAGLKTGEISSDLKPIGSRGRTRTFNHTINSRVLYH